MKDKRTIEEQMVILAVIVAVVAISVLVTLDSLPALLVWWHKHHM